MAYGSFPLDEKFVAITALNKSHNGCGLVATQQLLYCKNGSLHEILRPVQRADDVCNFCLAFCFQIDQFILHRLRVLEWFFGLQI